MRIGFNGWFLDQPYVGSGQYAHHLWRGLAAREDLTCLTFGPTHGDVVVRLRRWGPLAKVWYEQVDVPRAARGLVDLLHYPYFASPLVKTCPTIVTIHDLIPLLFPEYSASPAMKLYNALIALAARRADAIIAVSEQTRKDIIKHLRIPGERIYVTYEAVGEAFHPQDDIVVEVVKRKYGLGDYVFYIGGLNRHKNVQTLLAAFARLRRQLSRPYQLVIAGRAHSHNARVFPDPRPMASSLGLTWAEGKDTQSVDVRFLGFVPEEDKPALYAGAAVFVYPSLYEGFGFCPLEAMATGVPVISSRAASLAEIVGDGGLLVEPTDAEAMATAMLMVLKDTDLARSLRESGLRQAARFSWARTVDQTIAVYRRVLRATS